MTSHGPLPYCFLSLFICYLFAILIKNRLKKNRKPNLYAISVLIHIIILYSAFNWMSYFHFFF